MDDQKEIFKNIKLLALDFDGVMTVGAYVWTDQDGREAVQSSRRDGFGIEMLKKQGFDAMVISKETNPVVAARCRKLNIEYTQGVHKGEGKLQILEDTARERGLDLSEICYMGDDLMDIPCMKAAGLGIAVADARSQVIAAAAYVTKAEGGRGAVREVCEMILTAHGIELKWD